MIRRRNPRQDDKVILELVELLLLPYARLTQPELRVTLPLIRERLKGSSTYVSSGGGGRTPSGFITLRNDRESVNIDMLAVHPRAQGKGIGSKLMEHAERFSKLAGKDEIRLWVDDTNAQAQRFYASKNYVPIQYNSLIRCYQLSKRLHLKE
ncbi:GNAT family N-acetyltransferase [Paenibacillus sp. UNC451MF]|uniref:GNAT family N-acetyltransferase n=1 Tax=Paenibacillus sp. UNC451MF TaxID=1449063 RepID=UPI00048A8B01|nr:GNAT family N-acetyltransferase [Paenibacillus sp. UNC451MF]